jgi:hypothetical protein
MQGAENSVSRSMPPLWFSELLQVDDIREISSKSIEDVRLVVARPSRQCCSLKG